MIDIGCGWRGDRTAGSKRRNDETSETDKRYALGTKKRNARCLPIKACPRGLHAKKRRRHRTDENHSSDRT
jgi:hypothetical protein